MANPELLNAVRAEAESFLSGQSGMWHVLNERVADELAPLIADLVQQELVAALQHRAPDPRLVEAKAAMREAVELYRERLASRITWDDYTEDVVAKLAQAGEALPESMPPVLGNPSTELHQLAALKNAAKVAHNVLDYWHPGCTLSGEAVLAAVQLLRAALGDALDA